jgi:hypothetical protein
MKKEEFKIVGFSNERDDYALSQIKQYQDPSSSKAIQNIEIKIATYDHVEVLVEYIDVKDGNTYKVNAEVLGMKFLFGINETPSMNERIN